MAGGIFGTVGLVSLILIVGQKIPSSPTCKNLNTVFAGPPAGLIERRGEII